MIFLESGLSKDKENVEEEAILLPFSIVFVCGIFLCLPQHCYVLTNCCASAESGSFNCLCYSRNIRGYAPSDTVDIAVS